MWRLIRGLVLGVLAGYLLHLAFPAPGIWGFAFGSIVLLCFALLGQRWWSALLIGFTFGATFWLSLIRWLTLYLGPVPWLALGILQALFTAVGAWGIWLVLTKLDHAGGSFLRRLIIVPAVVAAIWASREMLASSWPYGGFSWGRLAQSQSDSPFRFIVAWLGVTGLSFVIAFISVMAFQLLRLIRRRVFATAMFGSVVVALVFVPMPPIAQSGTTSVLAVQGNSKAGLFDDRTSGDILADHVQLTLPLQGKPIDMIVWPENASDLDPTQSLIAAKTLTSISTLLKAPIVTGAIVLDRDGRYSNSSLVWDGARGPVARYDKIHPVPFAEYMPDRAFWRSLAPDLVDLVGYDYQAGTRSPVVSVNGVSAGITICFDITVESQLRDMVHQGASIVLAQTNNADFGQTDENLQQLAIARLAAIEMGRSVVNISTVGTSQIMSTDGTTIAAIPAYQPASMLTDVPLSRDITPAMTLSPAIEIVLGMIAALGLFVAFFRRNRP